MSLRSSRLVLTLTPGGNADRNPVLDSEKSSRVSAPLAPVGLVILALFRKG